MPSWDQNTPEQLAFLEAEKDAILAHLRQLGLPVEEMRPIFFSRPGVVNVERKEGERPKPIYGFYKESADLGLRRKDAVFFLRRDQGDGWPFWVVGLYLEIPPDQHDQAVALMTKQDSVSLDDGEFNLSFEIKPETSNVNWMCLAIENGADRGCKLLKKVAAAVIATDTESGFGRMKKHLENREYYDLEQGYGDVDDGVDISKTTAMAMLDSLVSAFLDP